MAMAASAVQLYRSTDQGALACTGQVGTWNAILQAVLVDGLTPASVSSITESGSVYTVNLAVANATLNSGNYVKLAGATGGFTALNDRWGPITVLGTTSFTFVGPGGLGTPATGTITYAKAPLGWSNAFATASNIATFRGQSVTGRTTQHYLRVDDSGSGGGSFRECAVRSYVTMSDKDTGTEPYPTVVQQAAPGRYWRKSSTLDATARPWMMIGDGASFYLNINSDNSATAGRMLWFFGGHPSDIPSDAYNSVLFGNGTSNSGTTLAGGLATVTNLSGTTTWANGHAPRSYTQLGTALAVGGIQGSGTQASPAVISQLTGAPFPYPHAPDGKLYVGPILLAENGLALRGKMPGLYHHMHQTHPCVEYDQILPPVSGLAGITLRAVSVQSNTTQGFAFFDEFGPW